MPKSSIRTFPNSIGKKKTLWNTIEYNLYALNLYSGLKAKWLEELLRQATVKSLHRFQLVSII